MKPKEIKEILESSKGKRPKKKEISCQELIDSCEQVNEKEVIK